MKILNTRSNSSVLSLLLLSKYHRIALINNLTYYIAKIYKYLLLKTKLPSQWKLINKNSKQGKLYNFGPIRTK